MWDRCVGEGGLLEKKYHECKNMSVLLYSQLYLKELLSTRVLQPCNNPENRLLTGCSNLVRF